ncbi:DegV family protein [Caloranaerobacter ferrireducens]|uniref:DegV family protein n=1 Tax=Caloranaerobacter ferrireducens TaxID=1323370 RepID=UPI00084DDA3F|nr:DegV family protein [Caloranaerobacter ferrireducens]
MTVRIITDSACDLPKNIIDEYNIRVIPILVYLENIEYLDGETLNPVDLYNNMRNGKVYKTAQIPPATFKEVFLEYANKNESVIYVAFSSGLSGTYQSALMAKNEVLEEYPDFDLEVIDTKCASVGFGLVVYKAAQMAKEGKSKEEIINAINFYSQHMEHVFTVDDLEYLYRGGRVSRTAAFVGSLLNIKPILDVEDGKLVPIEKVRGRKKVLKRMIEIMEERGVDLSNQVIGINHGDDLEGAKKLEDMIRERFGCKEFIVNIVGCAIGAHSGPGTLSVFFLNEKPPM